MNTKDPDLGVTIVKKGKIFKSSGLNLYISSVKQRMKKNFDELINIVILLKNYYLLI